MSTVLYSNDWPQAFGPNRDFSVDGKAVETFSVSQNENILWRFKMLSTGQGTPIISNGRIFVTSHERIEKDSAEILNNAIDNSSRFKGKIFPYASKASTEVTNALIHQAQISGLEFDTGITVSSPGFYGPSSRIIDGLKNTLPDIKGSLSELNINGLKAHNMEMESSLLFHLCAQMGYRAGTICTVISGPAESDSIIDYDAAIGNTINIGLNALVELNDSE